MHIEYLRVSESLLDTWMYVVDHGRRWIHSVGRCFGSLDIEDPQVCFWVFARVIYPPPSSLEKPLHAKKRVGGFPDYEDIRNLDSWGSSDSDDSRNDPENDEYFQSSYDWSSTTASARRYLLAEFAASRGTAASGHGVWDGWNLEEFSNCTWYF